MPRKENPFEPVAYNQNQRGISLLIGDLAKNLYDAIELQLVDSREKSLAKTRLEECVMWANKSIAVVGTSADPYVGGDSD